MAALLFLSAQGRLWAENATNLIQEIRAASAPPQAVWGRPIVGEASSLPADPRAAEVGARLQKLVQPAPAPPAAGRIAPQAQAALQRQDASDMEVVLRPGNQTVMQMRGTLLEPAASGLAAASEGVRAERTARNLLNKRRELLRLDNPDQELKLEEHIRHPEGGRTLKFSQVFQGVPLWPAGLNVHLDNQGNAAIVDGAYIPTPKNVLVQPVKTAGEAIRHARKSVSTNPLNPGTTNTDPSLIIYAPLLQAPRLAWKLDISTDLAHAWRVVVDAEDGRILSRTSLIHDVNVAVSAKGMDGVAHTINVWSNATKFYLADTTKPMYVAGGDPTLDPKGVVSIFDAQKLALKDLKTVYLIDSVSIDALLPEGVSTSYNLSQAYDFFLEKFGRNSLDGKGGNVQGVVRVAELDNAFWNGQVKMMFFGAVQAYPLSLDVAGHELTHAVTQNSADLIYELQPGALNEALSDIFGEMIERHIQGQNDWKLGESLGEAFRDMKNPGSIRIPGLDRPYPSRMSEFVDLQNSDKTDHGGVHVNSSIVNHCFYLLAEGMTDAIGPEKAMKIFYKALTAHLQKQSQFIDARLAAIASAEELFGAGSTEAKKTADAFDTVEIFPAPPSPTPSPVPVVSAPDSTVFIGYDGFNGMVALGRREEALNDPIDGVVLAEPAKQERPSVSGDGTVALLASGLDDVCAVPTADPNSIECLGAAGSVHSVALSPDGKLAAFILLDPETNEPDNHISVYDFVQKTARTFKLLAPVLDGSPVDAVLYADSMMFTSDSKLLIYDAVSQIRFGGAKPVPRWSISAINLATESTVMLVPPLEAANFGNPSLGRAGNRYLTFDAQNMKDNQTIILNFDLFTGDAAQVGVVGNGTGYPCFTGDERAIIYATEDPQAAFTGFSLVKQDLNSDRLTVNGQPSLWISDAVIGVIYRRGTFVAANQPPTIALTAPADHASFTAPGQIALSATASDPDGSIGGVEFYNGSIKIGESAKAPYTCAWSNVPSGTYRLLARAIDQLGAITDSAPITITVQSATPSPSKLAASRIVGGGVHLTLSGPPGNFWIQRSVDLKNWKDQMPVTIDASGSASTDDSTASQSAAVFYRAKTN